MRLVNTTKKNIRREKNEVNLESKRIGGYGNSIFWSKIKYTAEGYIKRRTVTRGKAHNK